jgi:DNA-directed RNA polymerase specialized sigma subunit
VIPAKDIAAQLGLSPVALSRRSARLMARLDEQLELLEDVLR